MTATSTVPIILIAALVATGCTSRWEYAADLNEPADTLNFGDSLALSGEEALVGSSGVVDLFRRPPQGSPLPPNAWLPTVRFQPTRGAPPGLFGNAVDIDDDLIAIGAPIGDPALINNGYVDVYERTGVNWTLLQRLQPSGFVPPPPDAPELLFGSAVTIAGDEIMVGAHHYDDTSGLVFVFERINGSFVQTQILQPDSNIRESGFGEIIRVSDDTMAIARAGPGGSGVGAGSPFVPGEVHLYAHHAGGWILDQIVVAPVSEPSDYFGSGIDLAGARLAVRAVDSLYVFDRIAGNWTLTWQTAVAEQTRAPVALRPAFGARPAYLFTSGADVVFSFVANGNQSGYALEGAIPDPDQLPGLGGLLAVDGDILVAGAQPLSPRRVRVYEWTPRRVEARPAR